MDHNGGAPHHGGLGGRSVSHRSSSGSRTPVATPSRTPSTPGASSVGGGRLGTPSRGARTPSTPGANRLGGRTPGSTSGGTALPGGASGHSRTPSSGGRTPATPGTPGMGSSSAVTPLSSAGRERRSGRVSLGSIGGQSSSSSGGDKAQHSFYRSLSGNTPVSPGGRSLVAGAVASPVSAAIPRSYPASPAVHNGGQPHSHHPHPSQHHHHPQPHLDRRPEATPPLSTPSASKAKAQWLAIYDYSAQGEDELELRKGDIIEVLSKDYKISGDEGWWTGKCGGKVGVFPCNFVAPCDQDFSDLSQVSCDRCCSLF